MPSLLVACLRVECPEFGHLEEIQVRTGFAIRNLVRQLRPLRSATILSNGAEQTLTPDIPAEQQDLLDAIRSRNLRH